MASRSNRCPGLILPVLDALRERQGRRSGRGVGVVFHRRDDTRVIDAQALGDAIPEFADWPGVE